MIYNKNNDVAALLLDICQPQWHRMKPQEIDNLLSLMACLGTEMSKDKDFEYKYLIATKELYVQHLCRRREKNYKPPLFTDLDKAIRQRMKENQNNPNLHILVPEFHENTPAPKSNLRILVARTPKRIKLNTANLFLMSRNHRK